MVTSGFVEAREQARKAARAQFAPAQRKEFASQLRTKTTDELRTEVKKLESLAAHQAYKAASAEDVSTTEGGGPAVWAKLQERQDKLAVAREVLAVREEKEKKGGTSDDEEEKSYLTIHACLMIQCQIRKFRARKEANRRRCERQNQFKCRLDDDQKAESALLIQGQVRKRQARKEVTRRRDLKAKGVHPCDASSPAVAAGAPVPARQHGTLANTKSSDGRSLPLQAGDGHLMPAYRVHDVSDVPITEHELREEFAKLDKDGNGFIAKGEFKDFYLQLESFGVDESDDGLEKILAQYNMLGDSRLSFDEFAIIMLKLSQR